MLIDPPNHLVDRTSVIAQCGCGKQSKTLYKCYKRSIKRHGAYRCHACAMSTPEIAAMARAIGKRNKGRKHLPNSEAQKQKISKSLKSKMTPQYKAEISNRSKQLWADPNFRNKVAPKLASLWSNPDIKAKAIAGIVASHPGNVKVSKFHFGYHISPKAGRIFHASSYELAYYKMLDQDANVTKYDRCHFGIPYQLDNKIRTYIPDILIELANSDKIIVEIKPYKLKDTPTNLAKRLAAEKYCNKHHITFKLITENELMNLASGN